LDISDCFWLFYASKYNIIPFSKGGDTSVENLHYYVRNVIYRNFNKNKNYKMMKKIVLFVMSLALFSCKKEEKKQVEKVVKEEIKTPEIHKELYGIYTGDFFMEDSQKNIDQYPNADFEYKKISIKLTKITKAKE
jgi:hypothetical protein